MSKTIIHRLTESIARAELAPDFVEDFSTYSSTTDFLNDPNNYYDETADTNTDQMALDTGVGFGSLTQSIRYDYDWVGNCSSEPTVRRAIDFSLANVLNGDVPELWYQVDMMFQGASAGTPAFDTAWPNRGRAHLQNVSGTFQVGENISFSTTSGSPVLQRVDDLGSGEVVLWWADTQDPALGETVTGSTSGATGDCKDASKGCTQNNDLKLILMGQTGGSGRWGINVGNNLNRVMLVEAPTTGACYDTVCNDNIDGKPSDDGLTECEFTGPKEWDQPLFDGAWHEIRFHAKSASSDTTADGEMEVWIDGTKRREVLDIKMCADQIVDMKLGVNFGRPGFPMSLWWGQVQVWTTDPGW